MTRPFASALGASLVFACAISEAGTASGAGIGVNWKYDY